MLPVPAIKGENSESTRATTVEMDHNRRILTQDYNLLFSFPAIRNLLEIY